MLWTWTWRPLPIAATTRPMSCPYLSTVSPFLRSPSAILWPSGTGSTAFTWIVPSPSITQPVSVCPALTSSTTITPTLSALSWTMKCVVAMSFASPLPRIAGTVGAAFPAVNAPGSGDPGVDQQVERGDAAAVVGGEEQRRARDVVGLEQELEALQVDEACHLLRRPPLGHLTLGLDRPRDDAVDAHAPGPELGGHRPRQAVDRGLGRGVAGHADGLAHPRHRAEIDDRPAARADHRRRHRLDHEELVAQIDRHHLVPEFRRDRIPGVTIVARGVVDQRAPRAERRLDRGHRALERGHVAQVAGHEQRLGVAGGGERVGERAALGLGDVEEGDARSLRGELRDQRGTDPRAAAGDQHDAAVETRVTCGTVHGDSLMVDSRILTLRAGALALELAPSQGGSIVAFRKGAIDLMRATKPEDLAAGAVRQFASWPLVPWSNRIRNGRFAWRGRPIQLPVDASDPHAIHGVGWRLP